MREPEYTRSIARLLSRDVYALKVHTSYTNGVADSWYSGSRGDLWVEWKYLKRLPRSLDLCSGKQPILSQLQQDWLTCRHNEGRHVAVIVGIAQGGVIFPGLLWKRVIEGSDFLSFLRSKKQIADWITQQCVEGYAPSEIPAAAATSALAPRRARS